MTTMPMTKRNIVNLYLTAFSQLRELAHAFAEGQVSLPRVFWLDDAGRKMRTPIDLTDIE